MPRLYKPRRRTYPRRLARPTRALKAVVDREIMAKSDLKIKSIQASYFSPLPSTTWVEANMAWLPAGSGTDERIGRSITVTGLQFKGILENAWTSLVGADDYNVTRIVVYTGKNLNTSSGCLQAAGLTIDDPIRKDTVKFLDRKLHDEYVVLVPSNFISNGSAYVGIGPSLKEVSFYLDFKSKPITITYDGTAIADTNGGLFVAVKGDSIAPPGAGFIDGWVSMFYKDS